MQAPEKKYVVCEHDGDCQESAVATVTVHRPVFLSDYEQLRLCRPHALARVALMTGRGYRVDVVALDQPQLPIFG